MHLTQNSRQAESEKKKDPLTRLMMIVGPNWIQMKEKKIKSSCTVYNPLLLALKEAFRTTISLCPCLRNGREREFLVSAPLYTKRSDVSYVLRT